MQWYKPKFALPPIKTTPKEYEGQHDESDQVLILLNETPEPKLGYYNHTVKRWNVFGCSGMTVKYWATITKP